MAGNLPTGPPTSNIGGIGGRGRSTTEQDMIFMNYFTNNYFHDGTNVLATIQPVNRSNDSRNDC
jgi:hypothetical protein